MQGRTVLFWQPKIPREAQKPFESRVDWKNLGLTRLGLQTYILGLYK